MTYTFFDTKDKDCRSDLFFRHALEANLAFQESEFDTAITHIQRAINTPSISRYQRALCLANMAHLYIWKKAPDTDMAMRCIVDAYKFTNPGDRIRCLLVQLQGDVLYKREQYREAITFYWAVLQQIPRHDDLIVTQMHCYTDMGQCYLKLCDKVNGLRYLNFALRLEYEHAGRTGSGYKYIENILKDNGFVLPEHSHSDTRPLLYAGHTPPPTLCHSVPSTYHPESVYACTTPRYC